FRVRRSEIYTFALRDALPICADADHHQALHHPSLPRRGRAAGARRDHRLARQGAADLVPDRQARHPAPPVPGLVQLLPAGLSPVERGRPRADRQVRQRIRRRENPVGAPAMYRHPITIEPADIDHMGHVNNAVYLRWVQEAVVRYWETVAPAEAVAQHLWVALKHEISYRRPAFLEDTVVAEVLAERVQGARTFFSTIIKRGEDVLAEVRSSWCCL